MGGRLPATNYELLTTSRASFSFLLPFLLGLLLDDVGDNAPPICPAIGAGGVAGHGLLAARTGAEHNGAAGMVAAPLVAGGG